MGNDPVNMIDPSGAVSIRVVEVYTGGERVQKLNISLTTSKAEYAAEKVKDIAFAAAGSAKEIAEEFVKGEVESAIKDAVIGATIGPEGDSASMNSVVKLDTALEAAGLKDTNETNQVLTSISDFKDAVNSLSPEDQKSFEAVQGETVDQMVNRAQESYNQSIISKTF